MRSDWERERWWIVRGIVDRGWGGGLHRRLLLRRRYIVDGID